MASSTIDLWRLWQQERSGAVFESLVRPVLPALFDAARRSGLRAADADDVVQDALTELAREPGERPARVGIAPWLIRSVRLKSKMRLRSEARRRRRERAVAGREVGSEDGGERSVSQEVERALAELPDADRQILLLRFLYDLEYPEVAHVLGASVNACRIRVHRAVRRLRARLGPQAGALIAALPVAPVPTAAGLVGANAMCPYRELGRGVASSRSAPRWPLPPCRTSGGRAGFQRGTGAVIAPRGGECEAAVWDPRRTSRAPCVPLPGR